ncbi:hypothetical protein bcgnr5378_05750 [Bacillus cereus]|uniref:hypothetical protein n=1 Tax=Bacillus cereus TaxID=1396 RepID=UPI0007AB9792|nr:hypothetical protein [Bacillus cereus]
MLRKLEELETKRYILTENVRGLKGTGTRLHQIKAIRKFDKVKEGQLDRWISHEDNLSQDGDARVSGNAQIPDGARIYSNARVYEEARVFGYAEVSGNAKVFGKAHVLRTAQGYGKASCDSNHTFPAWASLWVYLLLAKL